MDTATISGTSGDITGVAIISNLGAIYVLNARVSIGPVVTLVNEGQINIFGDTDSPSIYKPYLYVGRQATILFRGASCAVTGSGALIVAGSMTMNTPVTLTPAEFTLDGTLNITDGNLAARWFLWVSGTITVPPNTNAATARVLVNAGDEMVIWSLWGDTLTLNKARIVGTGTLIRRGSTVPLSFLNGAFIAVARDRRAVE